MVLLVSRIKPTGKVHRLWRNYWERGRPGWPQCGEQRWLSPRHGHTPALLAGSPSPPALAAGGFTHGMAAGTATHAPHGCSSLRSIPGLHWMNVFLPDPSMQEQRAPARSWAPLCIRSYLCRGWLARAEQCWQVLWVTPEKKSFHQ